MRIRLCASSHVKPSPLEGFHHGGPAACLGIPIAPLCICDRFHFRRCCIVISVTPSRARLPAFRSAFRRGICKRAFKCGSYEMAQEGRRARRDVGKIRSVHRRDGRRSHRTRPLGVLLNERRQRLYGNQPKQSLQLIRRGKRLFSYLLEMLAFRESRGSPESARSPHLGTPGSNRCFSRGLEGVPV